MKSVVHKTLGLLLLMCFVDVTAIAAADNSQLRVTLESPVGPLKMGDTPGFRGTIANMGDLPRHGLIVYLSLVSLTPGHEEPVDLEDWSANKAIRIDLLSPGQSSTHMWNMRLIQAGNYAVALTVIDPKDQRPVVSPLVPFHIQPKPLLASKRILPVAIGEPLAILVIWAAMTFAMRRIPAH